jgi:hypothetical protein
LRKLTKSCQSTSSNMTNEELKFSDRMVVFSNFMLAIRDSKRIKRNKRVNEKKVTLSGYVD